MRRVVSSLVGRKADPFQSQSKSVVIRDKFTLGALRRLAKQRALLIASGQENKGKQRSLSTQETKEGKEKAKHHTNNTNTYALLIGIEYMKYANQGQLERLPGCHYDVKVMKSLLHNNLGVPDGNISIMTDDLPDESPMSPTNSKIKAQLEALLQKAKSGQAKVVWLHYSGHGTQDADINHNEKDGMNEAIVPSDFMDTDLITDDYFALWLRKFPASCKINILFDCCNSGSGVDLPYSFKGANTRATRESKNNIPANVTYISGCRDNQTSASDLAGETVRALVWRGAFTQAFEDAMNAYIKKPTDKVRASVFFDRIQKFLKARQYTQVPVFSTSKNVKLSALMYPL